MFYFKFRYTVSAENCSGVEAVTVSVKILDVPGKVEDMEVTSITRNSVTLTWKPPLIDGGSLVNNYVIQKRESTRKTWQIIGSASHRNLYKITQLAEGGIFLFRLVNK